MTILIYSIIIATEFILCGYKVVGAMARVPKPDLGSVLPCQQSAYRCLVVSHYLNALRN